MYKWLLHWSERKWVLLKLEWLRLKISGKWKIIYSKEFPPKLSALFTIPLPMSIMHYNLQPPETQLSILNHSWSQIMQKEIESKEEIFKIKHFNLNGLLCLPVQNTTSIELNMSQSQSPNSHLPCNKKKLPCDKRKCNFVVKLQGSLSSDTGLK